MPKLRLTRGMIQHLPAPESGQTDYFDEVGPRGFGLRVSHGGTRTFFLLYWRNGKQKRVTIGRASRMTLQEARAEAKRIDALREDPRKADLQRAGSFESLTAAFLASQTSRLKASTLKEWGRIIRVDVVPTLGGMKPHKITRADVRALLGKKSATPYAANRTFEVIHRVFSWALREELAERNPVAGLSKPHKEKARERVLSDEEMRLLMRALAKERPSVRALFLVALMTGARKGELLAAKWADVDAKLWTLPETKAGRPHLIPLPTKAAELLERDRVESLFGVSRRSLTRAIERIRRRSGLDFRFHDLRRTAATGLARRGTRPDVISAILGHSIGRGITSRVYDRYSRIPEMREALEGWAEELAALENSPS